MAASTAHGFARCVLHNYTPGESIDSINIILNFEN